MVYFRRYRRSRRPEKYHHRRYLLCDEKHPIILESMEFPEPVIRVAIEPKTKAGQEKMAIALAEAGRGGPDL